MEIMFYLTFLLVAALARGDSMNMLREENSNSDDKAEKEEETNESFGSPVYGASNILPYSGLPVSGKSAYTYPAPPVSALAPLPASYPGYIANLGLNNPYAYGAYNRYNYMPYANPYYGYGPASSNALGYGSSLYSGFGYGGIASPYYGRSTYPVDGYSYPGFAAGLGYRYGGLNYGAPVALRGVPVAKSVAPVYGVPPPVTRGPVPVAGILPSVTAFAAPVPGPLSAVSPYRSPVRAVQSKDGSVRYTYSPLGVQGLQVY